MTKFRHLAYASLTWAKSNKPGWNAFFTLRFGEETVKVKTLVRTHEISVGISSAQIDFKLTDSSLPDDDWTVDPRSELDRWVDRTATTQEVSEELNANKSSISASSGVSPISISTKVKNSGETEDTRKTAQTRQLSDAYGRQIAWVYASGGPMSPRWNIRCPDDEKILAGTIFKNQRFARLEKTGPKPAVTIELRIQPHSIEIRGEDGVFHNINKQKIAKAAIKKLLCAQPHELNTSSPVEQR